MKRFVLVAVMGGALLLAGCKKNSNNPVAPPAEQASAATFTMHMESGTQGMIFVASPSMDVRVSKVIVTFPAQQFADTVENPQPTTIYTKGASIQIGEYTGVEMKQIWILTFIGSEAVSGKPFSTVVRWEVI